MARQEFLLNLKTAAGFLSPRVQANGVRLGSEYLERILRRSTIWLTPRALDGFDVADYPDLDPKTRDRLVRAIERFQAVARRIDPKEPASDADLAEAGPAFAEILDILGDDLEGFSIYQALKAQRFPAYVRDYAIGLGEDSTGDPAAWIWLIVSDESRIDDYIRDLPELRDTAKRALDRAREDRLLYLGFRAESEQREDIESEQLDEFARWARIPS